MKKYKITQVLIFSVFMIALASCRGDGKKPEKESPQSEALLMEVSINGMTCTGCEQTIQTNIGKLEGIKSVKASFTTGNAVIEYFPGIVDSVKIKEAITGSGYKVKKFSASPSEEPTR
jgi:copper chaperone CopZ